MNVVDEKKCTAAIDSAIKALGIPKVTNRLGLQHYNTAVDHAATTGKPHHSGDIIAKTLANHTFANVMHDEPVCALVPKTVTADISARLRNR